MSDKKFVIQGNEYDYGDMSNDELLNMYNQLIERQRMINKRMSEQE